MALSDLPIFYDMKYVDENRNMTSDAYLYNDSMFQTLNAAIVLLNQVIESLIETGGTVNYNGLRAPIKTTSQINTLEPDSEVATMWFDSDDAKLKVKTASGTVETIKFEP